jgi:dienelactone hydrolase
MDGNDSSTQLVTMQRTCRLSSVLLLLCFVLFSANVAAEEQTAVLPQGAKEAWPLLARLYEYDNTIPLEARTVEIKEIDGLRREKIVFRTTQGFLASGYLQLPATGTAPFPCVLLLHGWSGSKESWYQDNNYISGGNIRKLLLERGYATFMLDAQCHGDRIAVNDFAPINHHINEEMPVGQRRKGYFTQREIYTQTVVDYRRAIDYLDTRPEIDIGRIGLIGYSMGGTQSFMLTAVEPRIQATVACATPSELQPHTLYAPQNYIHAIGDRPFFMVAGNNDTMCPMIHAKQLYTLIPSSTKDLKFYDGSHKLIPTFALHAVEWIETHIGD